MILNKTNLDYQTATMLIKSHVCFNLKVYEKLKIEFQELTNTKNFTTDIAMEFGLEDTRNNWLKRRKCE